MAASPRKTSLDRRKQYRIQLIQLGDSYHHGQIWSSNTPLNPMFLFFLDGPCGALPMRFPAFPISHLPGALMENMVCLQRWLLSGKVAGSLNTAEMMARKPSDPGEVFRGHWEGEYPAFLFLRPQCK